MYNFHRTQIDTINKAWRRLKTLARHHHQQDNANAALKFERTFRGYHLAKAMIIVQLSLGLEQPNIPAGKVSTSRGLCWARVFGASLGIDKSFVEHHETETKEFQEAADQVRDYVEVTRREAVLGETAKNDVVIIRNK